MLFVLALRLALWKCRLAAMTQRYSIREGKNEREREREEEVRAEPAAEVCHWASLAFLSCSCWPILAD